MSGKAAAYVLLLAAMLAGLVGAYAAGLILAAGGMAAAVMAESDERADARFRNQARRLR